MTGADDEDMPRRGGRPGSREDGESPRSGRAAGARGRAGRDMDDAPAGRGGAGRPGGRGRDGGDDFGEEPDGKFPIPNLKLVLIVAVVVIALLIAGSFAACNLLGIGKSSEEIATDYQGTWIANNIDRPLSGFSGGTESTISIDDGQAIIWFGGESREFEFVNSGTASEFRPVDEGNGYRGEMKVGHLALSDGTGTVVIYEKSGGDSASANEEKPSGGGGGGGIFGLGVKPFNAA